MKNITIYTKENCPQCTMTKRFLTDKAISFEERNIDTEPQYIDWLKDQGFRSVPVVKTDRDDFTIVGFRPDQLKALAI